MAVVMSMHWPEASLEQYEQARKDVKWETKVPQGAQFHVAWMAADGFRALDLWDSAEDFQWFAETRLGPAMKRIGIQGQPNVTLAPVHAIFAPNVARQRSAPRASAPAKPAARAKAKPAARKPAKPAKAAKAKKAKNVKKASAKGGRRSKR